MEVQNRERLRQARTNEWISLGGEEESPVDEDAVLEGREREMEMEVQAEELARRRRDLQVQLEDLTGRDYPLPETYIKTENRDGR